MIHVNILCSLEGNMKLNMKYSWSYSKTGMIHTTTRRITNSTAQDGISDGVITRLHLVVELVEGQHNSIKLLQNEPLPLCVVSIQSENTWFGVKLFEVDYSYNQSTL